MHKVGTEPGCKRLCREVYQVVQLLTFSMWMMASFWNTSSSKGLHSQVGGGEPSAVGAAAQVASLGTGSAAQRVCKQSGSQAVVHGVAHGRGSALHHTRAD